MPPTPLRVIVLDPDPADGCSDNCRHLERLAESALRPAPLSVTSLRRVPEDTAPDPDAIVLRAPFTRPLAELLRGVRHAWRSAPVLASVCHPSRSATELLDSLQHGLDDFFCCPFPEAEFVARLRRMLPRRGHAADIRREVLVGDSAAFRQALDRTRRIAASSATVLIAGETGVGKEMFARAIHYGGPRRSRPFIPVNCGALPDTLFENELFGHAKGAYTDASTTEQGLLAEAQGGTLFLDEVATLSTVAQGKLLRFLQDREYRPLGASRDVQADVRVIAACNIDLRQMVGAGRFREDLFYRLNVLCVRVPPLRDRLTDVPLLARHFLTRYAAQYDRNEISLAPAALRKILSYGWPGNVRELESLLHRAVVFNTSNRLEADEIEIPASLPAAAEATTASAGERDRAMHAFERAYLTNLLSEHAGNLSRASRHAGTDRRTLQRLLRKHDIRRRDFQTRP